MYFIIGDEQDRTTWKIESRRGRARNIIVKAPIDPLTNKPEDVDWLNLEMVELPGGSFELQATVDSALKTQILAQRASDKAAEDQAEQQKLDRLKTSFTRVKNFNPQQVKDLSDIRQALKEMSVLLIELAKAYKGD